MSVNNELSRRRVLASVGALGAAFVSGSYIGAQDKDPEREPAAPRTSAKFKWRIAGDEKPEQHVCGDTPPTPYMVVAEPGDVEHARLLHVIWHKTAPTIMEAIDRVIVDTDTDRAAGKTPHFAHLLSEPRPSTLATYLIYAICYFDFCSVGKYDLHVTVVWEDTSEVEFNGVKQPNYRRHIETQTMHIDAQRRKAP